MEAPAKQRGFVLLELLAVGTILLVAVSLLFLQGQSLQRQYYKQQVRVVAQLLAADLRQLQQRTLFKSNNVTRKLSAYSDQSSYKLMDGWQTVAARVDFAQEGCGDVYFSQVLSEATFGTSGAPTYNGEYALRHRNLSDFCCRVALQPVTGRVLIYEGE